jgi:hypothetical protein
VADWRRASLRRMLRGRFGHVVGGVGIALPYRLGGAGGGVLGRLQLHLGVQLGPTKTTQAERYKEPSSRDNTPMALRVSPAARRRGLSYTSDTARAQCGLSDRRVGGCDVGGQRPGS